MGEGKIIPATAVLLLCVACATHTASQPTPVPATATIQATPKPTPVPTPVVVVSTTAKQIDTSAVATLTASTLFDIPEGKYLLVRVTETKETCMTNCKCPAPYDDNWNELGASERRQIISDMTPVLA